MWETIQFLAAPFSACVLMVVILGYFGNHILAREVIFVDIAVAQVAALGTMVGILLGFAEGSISTMFFSLGLTLLVITIFALTKFRNGEISQEVVIGVIYCLALALAFLLVDAVPGGSNFVEKTFSGAILWVTWKDVGLLLVVFSAVGLVHMLLARRFLAISLGQDSGLADGQRRLLELVFYVTFAVTIVEAVRIAGVFLVFMYLIGPASLAWMVTRRWATRLSVSWLIGVLGSFVGIFVSYQLNFPNGPTIVLVLGLLLLGTALLKRKEV